MGMPKAKSVTQFVVDNMDIHGAIDPALRRVAAHVRRTRKGTGIAVREKIHVTSVACKIYTCCCGSILGVGSNLTDIAGCDTIWDRVPANDGSSKRGLLVRVLHEEIVCHAEEHILHIRYRVGLDGIVLKIDEND